MFVCTRNRKDFFMNKKAISEIRKQFKQDNQRFSIERMVNLYVDKNNDIRYERTRRFGSLPENEISIYLESAKKTLGGQIGKALNSYDFPAEEYSDDGTQEKLYLLLKSELADEDIVHDYTRYLVNNLKYNCDYYITIMYCTYSIKPEDEDAEDDTIFNFLLFSFNFVTLSDIGLFYNEESREIEKKCNSDYIVVGAPIDGFMFPCFTGNCADVNSVLVFTKKPKEPNKTIVEDILGCKFTMSAEEERTIFETIVGETLGSDIDYDKVTSIHQKIRDVIASQEMEENTPLLNKREIRNILSSSGVKENDLVLFDSCYDSELGADTELRAVNLVDANKVNIKTPDVVVNVKAKKADSVTTGIHNGKKCLIISLDDSVQVDGIDVDF